jgi:hypothetical protein
MAGPSRDALLATFKGEASGANVSGCVGEARATFDSVRFDTDVRESFVETLQFTSLHSGAANAWVGKFAIITGGSGGGTGWGIFQQQWSN